MLLALLCGSAQGQGAKEHEVKAAFLYNFTKFIEWPPTAFGSEQDPIVIALIGRHPIVDELEKIVRDRKVNGHPIRTVRLNSGELPGAVHVVFVAAGEERRFERELAAWQKLGALTVGESDHFGALGGMVTFTTVDEKVRFEINAAAAAQAGLKISAQLQKLATTVRRNR